ncbi:methyltransferase domain-containing protein, partial [Sulfurimonas sp.]
MEFTGERFIPALSNAEDDIYYEHYNRYISIAEMAKEKYVLDAACGSGYGSGILADVATQVYGIDIDAEAIEYAQNTYAHKNLEFQTASVTEIPFEDDTFDIVISFETIEHLAEPSQQLFMDEIERVLKQDGILIMSTPDKELYSEKNLYNNHFHIKEFYEKEFYNFLRSRFKHVNFIYQRNEICNVISGHLCNDMKVIRKDYLDSSQGKYIIAICSQNELVEQKCASLQIHTGEYGKKIHRIIELQNEVEEKNKWAFSLDEEVENLRSIINDERTQFQSLQIQLQEKESLIQKQLEESKNKDESIQTLESNKEELLGEITQKQE